MINNNSKFNKFFLTIQFNFIIKLKKKLYKNINFLKLFLF